MAGGLRFMRYRPSSVEAELCCVTWKGKASLVAYGQSDMWRDDARKIRLRVPRLSQAHYRDDRLKKLGALEEEQRGAVSLSADVNSILMYRDA